jgi:hypothetical protein
VKKITKSSRLHNLISNDEIEKKLIKKNVGEKT